MERIKLLYISLAVILVAKMVVYGANFAEAPILAILVAASLFYEHSPKNKQLQHLNSKLEDLEKQIASKDAAINELRSGISSVKMGIGMKTNKVS